jgi:hypothetical protein
MTGFSTRVALGIAFAAVCTSGCLRQVTPPANLTIEEGNGFTGICTVGDRVSDVRRSLGGLALRHADTDSEWSVYESRSWGLIVDTLGRGRRVRVCRIVVLLPSPSRLTTRMGLVISPGQRPATNELTRVYGTPSLGFGPDVNSWLREIADAIRTGTSYSILSPDASSRFWHYPSWGISFLIQGSQASRVYIDRPYDRPVWRF